MLSIILTGIMYLLSIGLGIASVYLVGYGPMKTFKDFGMLFVYELIFYFGLKIIILIINWIENKIYKVKVDSDTNEEYRQGFALVYFAVSFIGIAIVGYISTKSIFSTVLLVLIMFMVKLIQILAENSGSSLETPASAPTKSNNYDIKTGYVTDEFGNIKAKSTTYTDGDIKKTYVTDNLGNTIAESTTIGNHTTTKLRK